MIHLRKLKKFEDTKGIIRSHNLKDRQYNDQKLEDTKGIIRSHNLKKDRQYNDKKCATCQDLHTLQFLSKSHDPFWSYCPFFIKFSEF